MSYRITYTNKYTGRSETHINRNSQADAEGWGRELSRSNNGCGATVEHVADGPYDHSGKVTHVVTVGHDD